MYQPGVIEDISIEDISKNILGYEEDISEDEDEDIIFSDNDNALYTSLISAFLSKNVSVINLRNINTLCDWYGLPYGSAEFHSVGKGELYYTKERFHPMVVFLCTLFSILSIVFIGYRSYEQINESEERGNV